jgi:hypothetical protein
MPITRDALLVLRDVQFRVNRVTLVVCRPLPVCPTPDILSAPRHVSKVPRCDIE